MMMNLISRAPLLCLPCPQQEREPGNEVEIMDDIQCLKKSLIRSSGHHLPTRQLAPDKPHFNPVPKVELDSRFFLALNYYIKHCHSSEQ